MCGATPTTDFRGRMARYSWPLGAVECQATHGGDLAGRSRAPVPRRVGARRPIPPTRQHQSEALCRLVRRCAFDVRPRTASRRVHTCTQTRFLGLASVSLIGENAIRLTACMYTHRHRRIHVGTSASIADRAGSLRSGARRAEHAWQLRFRGSSILAHWVDNQP